MIRAIFDLQNPWRSGSTDAFKLKERTILKLILDQLESRKISGIIGSRQVGKSSLLYLIIAHLIRQKRDIENPKNIFQGSWTEEFCHK